MWEEKNKRNIEITTGDGVVFSCLWNYAEKFVEFNNSIFDFINKKKSFVDRRNPKSRALSIVFYFQGDNHLEMSEKFEKSSEDKRYWVVNHPLYGIIYGHPLSISYVNDYLNISTITVEFMETIIDEAGINEVVFSYENSEKLYDETSVFAAQNFETVEIDSQLRKSLSQNILDISSKYRSLYTNNNMKEIQKRIRVVSNSVDNVINVPYSFVTDLYSLVGYVSFLNSSVFDKIDFCQQIYNDFKGLLNSKTGNKKYFELSAASALGAAALSIISVDNAGKYSKKQLFDLKTKVEDMYNDYFETLENNEVNFEKHNDTFIVDFTTQNNLYSLVVNSVYKLMNLIYDARKEINIVLEKDTNIVILTHRYLGLDDLDENIELFKTINAVKTNGIFVLPKGSKVKYYA